MVVPHAFPASALYAVVRSPCAVAAVGSARCCDPDIVQVGKPVIALPGLTPTLALMVPTGPTQLTAVPAKSPYVCAEPRDGPARRAPGPVDEAQAMSSRSVNGITRATSEVLLREPNIVCLLTTAYAYRRLGIPGLKSELPPPYAKVPPRRHRQHRFMG